MKEHWKRIFAALFSGCALALAGLGLAACADGDKGEAHSFGNWETAREATCASAGEEIREFYRLTAETELKTLQVFAEKWRKLAEQMIGIFPDNEAERYVDFADSLSALLGKDPDYFLPKEEKAPAAEEEKFDPQAVIGKYIENEEEEENGFNLDDVLNPKGGLDLEKLCRNLGLMDDGPQTK